MPIFFQQLPLQKLLSEDSTSSQSSLSSRPNGNSYSYRTKEEDANDIQAIRLYRALKIGQKYNVVGSDIFLIEDAIKAKLAAYNQQDSQFANTSSNQNVEKLPKINPARGRKLKMMYKNKLEESNSAVLLSEKGLPYSSEPSNSDCLTWAIKYANQDLHDLKKYLHSIEEHITKKEIELCGASLSDRKYAAAQEELKKDKVTLLEKLEKCEASAQKRFLLLQRIGPLATVKHHASISPIKSSISRRGARTSFFSPMRSKMTISPRGATSTLTNPALSSSSPSPTGGGAGGAGGGGNPTLLASPGGPSNTIPLPTISEKGNLVITKEQKEKFQPEILSKGAKQQKRKKSFFVTDNPSTSTLLTVDSTTSMQSGISVNSSEDLPLSPRPPPQPMSQRQVSNPRRITSRPSEEPESLDLPSGSISLPQKSPVATRRSSLQKCALVANLLERHSIPEITFQADYGGIVEDINAASFEDSPPSQHDFRKNIKMMRASVRYSVGVHNTVNKTIIPACTTSTAATTTESPPTHTNQPTESPTKLKQSVKLTTTTSQKNEGSIDSIMHMEALNTIGLSQKELEEKRLLDKQEKHKLGIPPSEYFENNRDRNAKSLMKIVAEGKERRRNITRTQVNFRKLQQQKDEMASLDATKCKLLQSSIRPHRKYDFYVEENLQTKSTLDYQESLSDFKHMTQSDPIQSGSTLPTASSGPGSSPRPGWNRASTVSFSGSDKTFESTKLLIHQALEKNEESLHEFLYDDHINHSHISSMSTLTPRDGNIHFRKIHKRMMEVKKNLGTQHFLRHRWFVTILSDLKRNPNPPSFLLSLLSATANYLSLGKELNPDAFFSLLEATTSPSDHQHPVAHEVISTIRENSGVSPPQLLAYFDTQGIKPTTALLAQVKVYQNASTRKKKLVVMKKMVTATKKSTLKAIRRDVVARASVAFSTDNATRQREIVRVLSMSTPERRSLASPLPDFAETVTTDSIPSVPELENDEDEDG